MAQQRSLIRFAKDAEDVASGLHAFRDSLPRNATRITATISELFSLSAILREVDNGEGDIQWSSSLYRVQDDLRLLLPTLRCTLDAAFDMFARSRDYTCQSLWDELGHKMEYDEGISFLKRLELYHDFLRGQSDVLQGHPAQDLHEIRKELITLYDAQKVSILRAQRLSIDTSASSTPRPRPPRPRPSRHDTPMSPTSASETWSDYISTGRPPPRAPEPPLSRVPTSPMSPLSPTFTFNSSSSQTLDSSQTSYSSDDRIANESDYVHWAQDIFDGEHPVTRFRRSCQLNEPSTCRGSSSPDTLQHLVRDGFVQALELPFDHDRLVVGLYYRPADSRARIMVKVKESSGRHRYHCTPLGNVKLFRRASTLHLCRARGNADGEAQYSPWAILNFSLYERMVLFYCTFVAMKRQDKRPVPHDDLMESFELQEKDNGVEKGDVYQYGGQILDGSLRHALRLYKDRTSGVVRLEGSAMRGPMKDVPLWTAFVSKYANDKDDAWAWHQGKGRVSLAALRPPPYIFLAGYELPREDDGSYVLQFTTDQDAREFVETWTGLCRGG